MSESSVDAVRPWPAGSTSYPGVLDGFTEETDGQYAKKLNDIAAALAKVQSVIGASPVPLGSTVRAQLNQLAANVNDLQVAVSDIVAVPGPVNTFYRFVQDAPVAVWDITHPLGRRPAVTVVDSAGTVVEGEIDYVSADRLTITFSAAFSGEANLS